MNPYSVVGLGLVVGVTVMMTSIGAGAITMPFLCVLLRSHKTQLLVGSDLAFAAVVATVAAALQYNLSNVNLEISAAMLAGSIPGVIIGSRLAARVSDSGLKITVGILLFITAIRMF